DDRVTSHRPNRLRRVEVAGAQVVDPRLRPGRVPRLEERFRLDQVDLAEAEIGEVIAVVGTDVLGVRRPLEDAGAFVLVGGRRVPDAVGEYQGSPLPIVDGNARGARVHVVLLSDEEDP